MRRGIATDRVARLNGTFVPLLIALLTVLVLAPLINHHRLLTPVLVSVLLLAGVFTVHRHHLLRLAAVVGLAFALCLRWIAHFAGPEHGSWLVYSHIVICAYLAFLTTVVFFTVLAHREITRNTVVGAVCGYLLIGYTFAFAHLVLEECSPGSIAAAGRPSVPEDSSRSERSGPEFMYFSFSTLTTLGYGDILPVSPLARSLAILEVLAGQLYLAAFVARLVGVMRARPEVEDPVKGGDEPKGNTQENEPA